MLLSLVIPVYKNQESLPRLIDELERLSSKIPDRVEVVFVVDGSPDDSLSTLESRLPVSKLTYQLILLSRNYGSFNAIRAGLEAGAGDAFAVMAADLQEPPELVFKFYEVLRADQADIVFGYREKRSDNFISQALSRLFWSFYRRFVLSDIPPGGVDVFGCTRQIRDLVLAFKETNTNLVALLLWLGFRRQFIPYERLARREGKSAWTLRKKLRYCVDSIFSFTDLPIKVLIFSGILGTFFAFAFGTLVLYKKLIQGIPIPGYTAIVLILLFFGGTTALGLGIIGQYLWLCLLNIRKRPHYIIASRKSGTDCSTRSRVDCADPRR